MADDKLTARFGDVVENGWASEDNPTRRGYFVRLGWRTGKMNAGRYWEITDRKGKFWELMPYGDHKITVTPSPDGADAVQAGRIYVSNGGIYRQLPGAEPELLASASATSLTISDAMVERGIAALQPYGLRLAPVVMREALEAALQPGGGE